MWSIPSLIVNQTEYRNAVDLEKFPDAIAKRFAKKILSNICINGEGPLISGLRQRKDNTLYTSLFNANIDTSIPLKTLKYEELKFLTPTKLLELNSGACSTCTSLYLQSLVNQGILPSTIEYLEIPPEIMDSGRKLEEYSTEELWRIAFLNYSLLLKGKTGGDGHFIRSLTLDRFLDSFIKNEINQGIKLLDLGCGDGGFLQKIGNRTEFAYGLELVKDMPGKLRGSLKRVKIGNLYNAPKIFRDICFDWIVLNLVIQWIPNLDKLAKVIRSLLVKSGKVLVTITTPEFTKNGQWIKKKDTFNWLITKPLRRERTLTMINRLVGPVWFYPRTTIDFLNIFGNNGLFCMDGQHIYLDTYLSSKEYSKVIKIYPSLTRHEILPVFTVLKFIKI